MRPLLLDFVWNSSSIEGKMHLLLVVCNTIYYALVVAAVQYRLSVVTFPLRKA